MTFELWDQTSGNRLATFEGPEEAFRLVLEMATEDGEEAVESLVLGVEDAHGRPHRIAAGHSLFLIAREAQQQPA